MANPEKPRDRSQGMTLENCCVHQIVCSMFEEVTEDEMHLSDRSDRKQILEFSNTLLEQELIFGSPPDDALGIADAVISEKRKKNARCPTQFLAN